MTKTFLKHTHLYTKQADTVVFGCLHPIKKPRPIFKEIAVVKKIALRFFLLIFLISCGTEKTPNPNPVPNPTASVWNSAKWDETKWEK